VNVGSEDDVQPLGTSLTGLELTEDALEELADEPEAGYDSENVQPIRSAPPQARKSRVHLTPALLDQLEQECENLLRSVLGDSRVDELHQAMLDVGVPAIDLVGDRTEHLGRLRDAALAGLAGQAPDGYNQLSVPFPWHLQDRDPALAVLELGMARLDRDLPESIFGRIDPVSRVMSAMPQLTGRLDEDGLLDLTGLDASGYGVVVDGRMLHFHQFLRRGFSGNMNYRLINLLLKIGARPGNMVRIAIDERRLTNPDEMRWVFEEDYWWGPKLSDAWLDNRYTDPIPTVHRYEEGNARLLLGYEAFFAHWRINGKVEKVFQAEELTTLDEETRPTTMIAGFTPLRYMHSIRDIEAHRFIHCDGAVRGYNPDTLSIRRAEEMPTATTAAYYRKVFRVDGTITTEEWSQIAAGWYRGNGLVAEYLAALDGAPED
jgi:hypothetical protein